MNESLREQIAQVLFATQGLSEGMTADAIVALLKQEAEPTTYEARIRYSAGWSDWKPCSREAYQEFSVPGACAGRYPVEVRELYLHPPKPAPVPQEIVDRLNEQLTRFITGQCTCSPADAPRETETEPGLQHYPGCPMVNKIKLAKLQGPIAETHRVVSAGLLEEWQKVLTAEGFADLADEMIAIIDKGNS